MSFTSAFSNVRRGVLDFCLNTPTNPDVNVSHSNHISRSVSEAGLPQINQYTLYPELGNGSFAKVRLCLDNDSSFYQAVKIISKRRLFKIKECAPVPFNPDAFIDLTSPSSPMGMISVLEKVKVEIEAQQNLTHANIVRIKEVINDVTDDKLYIVMSYCECGQVMEFDPFKRAYTANPHFSMSACSSFDTISKSPSFGSNLPQSFVKWWAYELALALEHLHQQRIVHRDLKPENILLSASGKLQLADFGVCHIFSAHPADKYLSNTAGTLQFSAPETLSGLPYDAYRAEIYSFGVNCYALCFGKLPFDADNDMDLFAAIEAVHIDFASPELLGNCDAVSSHESLELVRDFLTKVLEKDPLNRLSFDEIKTHPWLESCVNVSQEIAILSETCRSERLKRLITQRSSAYDSD